MASRRMFSKRIIGSARFLKMPISTQCLYFHLGLNADDDGVVEAYTIIKQIGATEDDLKVLVAKDFCTVLNEDLVTYITDWRENNKLRADRKIDSIYKDLLLQIVPDADIQTMTNRAGRKPRIPNWDGTGTTRGQHRIGEDRIGEDRIGKDSYHTHGKVPYGVSKNVYLAIEEYDKIHELIPSQADYYINKFSRYKAIKDLESHDDYQWIRGWMDEDEAIIKERQMEEAAKWDEKIEEEINAQNQESNGDG